MILFNNDSINKIINKQAVYFIFILFGLNLSIVNGLFIYNLFIVIYLLIKNHRLSLQLEIWFLIILIIFFTTITIVFNSLFNDIIIFASFEIPIKLIIFIMFFLFFREINYNDINYNIIIILISSPIFLSVIMFHHAEISEIILSFYGLEKYGGDGRFGGIYGRDVNTLGMFSTLILILVLILRKLNLINVIFSFIVIIFSLYAIALSGMRSGLIVYIGLLILLNKKLKIINYKYCSQLLVLILISGYTFYNISESSRSFIDNILERFSASTLLADFDTSGDGGNFNHIVQHLKTTIANKEINAINLFFGTDSNINFVDNLYVHSFLKHGLLFTFFIIILWIYFLAKVFINKNYILFYFLSTSFIISIKGTFILGNFYMFLFLFSFFVWISHHSRINNNSKNLTKVLC